MFELTRTFDQLYEFGQIMTRYDLQEARLMILSNVQTDFNVIYSTNHVYLHRPNAFGFWQPRLYVCYETLKCISNFSELA